ncbi:hypothetical protein CSC18_2611 [Klebsiella aerogenes]|nr:hypothetical protein CSC18_2611 [Klebsiella aerogenes]
MQTDNSIYGSCDLPLIYSPRWIPRQRCRLPGLQRFAIW